MEPLGLSASIVAVIQLTGTVIQYLNSVKDASRERQKILLELYSVQWMLCILQEQADQTEPGDPWSLTLQSLNLPGGPLTQFKILLDSLTLKLAPVKGLAKIGRVLLWPLEKQEARGILFAIERQKSLFNLAQQNDHIRPTKAIKYDLHTMHHKINGMSESLDHVQLNIDNEKLRSWLRAPDPSLNYNKALKIRHTETGSWLVSSIAFEDWKTGSNSFLWLYGIPGCGVYLFDWILITMSPQHSRS